ncbi:MULTISPECIES: DUF4097 family beta strand repeat-containing protein [Streptomyces]|uniref:DUF4097 domain-containing protein n=2 Tax=Streptomyces TaxID=1883 RepID=A0A2N8PD81_STRNR|nr:MULTISPECIES: DUF4097 family beta strand repeat-containing protein [Streptomyces]PNE38967.1 hypothetical protein AOB60_34150 [Streptomyces noursei]QRX94253.1 DUF4097 family beta strand repeat protein [Streptomyces noursei]UJB43969.1 DUF4097 family beta strand repeat protein [Streptomyces sp. A1-5]SHL20486.1 Putative adhesin [Streptomyces yunnanensis]
MSARTEWTVSTARTLEIEEPVSALTVRLVGGTVNVVGTSEGGPARLEISELHGPPVEVSYEDGVLCVGYDDVQWKGFLKFLDRRGWNRSAVVSVTVPTTTRVEVGVVGATAVVSGIAGRTELRGVSGNSTLVGLSGPVRADTVSGDVEAQALTGSLEFNSVSGDLTVVEGAGGAVHADSVSGDMVLDLDPAAGAEIDLTTISGEIAIRLPDPADAKVEANTTTGVVTNAFDDLRVSGQWGTKRITGSLGAGTGRLKATTVSGALALLRRPAYEEADGGPAGEPGDGPSPTTPPAGKKVL